MANIKKIQELLKYYCNIYTKDIDSLMDKYALEVDGDSFECYDGVYYWWNEGYEDDDGSWVEGDYSSEIEDFCDPASDVDLCICSKFGAEYNRYNLTEEQKHICADFLKILAEENGIEYNNLHFLSTCSCRLLFILKDMGFPLTSIAKLIGIRTYINGSTKKIIANNYFIGCPFHGFGDLEQTEVKKVINLLKSKLRSENCI